MSFVEFLQDDPLLTREQVMATLIQVANELDMPDKRGACIVAGMTVSQEAGVTDNDPPKLHRFWCPANHADPESFNYPHDSVSDDGRSVGYFQQQKSSSGDLWWGPTSSEMDLHSAATTFMTRLKKHGYDASNARTANDSAQAIQGSGVPDAYGQWWADINKLYDQVNGTVVAPPPVSTGGHVTDPNRPDFNEFPIWTNNCQERGGTKIDLFLLHTEEGHDNAESLANYFNSGVQVSYHYTISTGYPKDKGVTLVDCVDTDLAAWSVGDANNRSINLCFAGSSVNLSHDEWIEQYGTAIDVAAYIAVQDCHKYGISTLVVPPPYTNGTPGISDHDYVTVILKWGTHSDVGPNFPWDVFAAAVAKYAALVNAPAQPPVVTPPPPVSDDPTEDELQKFSNWLANANQLQLSRYIAAQMGPGDKSWASKGSTLRDKVWSK